MRSWTLPLVLLSIACGSAGTPDDLPMVCSEDRRRCLVEFSFPYQKESAAELRGDFREGGWQRGEPMLQAGGRWVAAVPVPYGKAVRYKVCVNGCRAAEDWKVDPAAPTAPDGSGNINNLRDPSTCSDFSCAAPPDTPPAQGSFDWRDAVMYFVFVDRFLDGRPDNNCSVPGVSGRNVDYQGGDWAGVTRKINDGYFSDLGVNALWLTVPALGAKTAGKGAGDDPRFYSGYHGYWPEQLDQPERCFGSMDELKTLVQAAHARGIKVLFDYAMVHIHKNSPLFRDNPGWFWPGGCICGQSGCDWNRDGKRCWFTDYLPHFNFGNDAARRYSVDNAVQWVKDTGIDGYRLDAIKHVEDAWLADLRGRIQSEIVPARKERFYMVGETYEFENRDFLKSFIDPARKLDGQFDFPLRLRLTRNVLMRKGGMEELAGFMDSNDNFYGAGALMSTWVGNHDIGRVIHMAEDQPRWDEWSNGDKAQAWANQPGLPSYRRPFERLANAFAVLFTNPGLPLIYYGDEVGLPGAGDPDNRRPMQWDGLSADQRYLQERVRRLLQIRQQVPALRRGQRRTLSVSGDLWVYELSADGQRAVVAVNRGDGPQSTDQLPSGALMELVESQPLSGPRATIPERQTRVFVSK